MLPDTMGWLFEYALYGGAGLPRHRRFPRHPRPVAKRSGTRLFAAAAALEALPAPVIPFLAAIAIAPSSAPPSPTTGSTTSHPRPRHTRPRLAHATLLHRILGVEPLSAGVCTSPSTSALSL